MSRVWGFLLVASLALGAHGADAQTLEPPRFTVGAGAGLSNPLHGDFDFVAPSWDLSVRGRPREHLTIEVFLAEWRHTERSDYFDIPIQTPAGIAGRIGRLSTSSTRSEWTTGINLLPTFSVGRFTVSGGGGGGYMVLHRRYRQTVADCTTTNATGCTGFQRSHGAGALIIQAAGGLDVALSRHFAAFAQSRVIIPIDDPGYGHSSLVAGVRLRLR
jgi:hypothetical protein